MKECIMKAGKKDPVRWLIRHKMSPTGRVPKAIIFPVEGESANKEEGL